MTPTPEAQDWRDKAIARLDYNATDMGELGQCIRVGYVVNMLNDFRDQWKAELLEKLPENPYQALFDNFPTDNMADWALIEGGKQRGFGRAVEEVRRIIQES